MGVLVVEVRVVLVVMVALVKVVVDKCTQRCVCSCCVIATINAVFSLS